MPVILAIPIALVLREPEPWKEAHRKARQSKDASQKVGSLANLFRHPLWRKHAFVGIALGLAGMAGLWGIGYFSPELISAALKGEPQKVVDLVRGYGTAFQDVGAFLGVGGVALFVLVSTLRGKRLVPVGDPFLPTSMEYHP